MSLLFNNQDVNIPQTHVFIIGVGGYPHISGGHSEKEQTVDAAKQLGQLSSPPKSAEAFYNSIIKLHAENAWIRPLGSIEVLLSPLANDESTFAGQNIDSANISNITNAYWEWKERCDKHPDNVAIFYFCGHGFEKDEQYLLTEDFGKTPHNPWTGCFAFDLTRRGFSTCKANTQLFFVDACRQITSDMLTTDFRVLPIDPPNLLAKDCLYRLTQQAAAINESAYGKKNDVSFYTQALIKALCGDASTGDDGDWVVNTGVLASKMTSFIKNIASDQGYKQRCISTTSDVTDIIRFIEPPSLSLTVTCAPFNALRFAELSYHNLNTDSGNRRSPETNPWQVDIKPGIYRIQADFPGSQYKNIPVFKSLMPPSDSQTLKCQQS